MLRIALVAVLAATVGVVPAHAVAFKMTDAANIAAGVVGDPGLRADQSMVAAFDGADSLLVDASRSSNFNYYLGAHPGTAFAPEGDTTTYAAIGAGGQMAFDLRDIAGAARQLASVSVYLGSIDVYNLIDIFGVDSDGAIDYGHALYSVSGSDLIGRAGGHPNGRVTFGFGDDEKIGGMVFRSTGVAFEFDSIGISTMRVSGPAPAGPVPEPASWAMMLGGFGLIGGAMRSRKRANVRFA